MANDILWSICVQTNPFDSIPICALHYIELHCPVTVMCPKHKPLTDRSIFVIASTKRPAEKKKKQTGSIQF